MLNFLGLNKGNNNAPVGNHQELSSSINAFGSKLFAQLGKDVSIVVFCFFSFSPPSRSFLTFFSSHSQNIQAKQGDASFLSPWGIAHALAMLLEGATPGSTSHSQLINVIFKSKSAQSAPTGEAVRDAVKALTTSITSSTDQNVLTVSDANSAWVRSDIHLKDSFVKALAAYFQAQASPLTSAEVVNSWVDEKTHGKIKTVIDDGAAHDSALILVSSN